MTLTKEQLRKIANSAANEIANRFSTGFFDDRMVEDVASIIYKHHKKFAKEIEREKQHINKGVMTSS